MDDENDTEWDGSIILMLEDPNSKPLHAMYPDYTVENHRECNHENHNSGSESRGWPQWVTEYK